MVEQQQGCKVDQLGFGVMRQRHERALVHVAASPPCCAPGRAPPRPVLWGSA